MFPRALHGSAITAAFSNFSHSGDQAVFGLLRRLLTKPGTLLADLRDLSAPALNELPDGYLRTLKRQSPGRPASTPPRVALPDGCTPRIVNLVLWELPGTEYLSAGELDFSGERVDLPLDTRLQLFETTFPPPPMHNPGQVPVLLRMSGGIPSCLPRQPSDSEAPIDRIAAVAGMRTALRHDGCRLQLPSPGAFLDVQTRLLAAIQDMHLRYGAGKAAAKQAGPAQKLLPIRQEAQAIATALRMVPRELLSAPAAIVVQDMLRRMDPDAVGAGLERGDLYRIVTLFGQQWDVAYPFRGDARNPRSPRDLATLARLQGWTWPDAAYAKAEAIDAERRARAEAGSLLRHAWERQSGFSQALERFTELGVPLPEPDLLRRLGVIQTEAPAAAHHGRHVRFHEPLADDADPS